MAGPITWRNVNTGGDSGGRLLSSATNAIGNSTNTLLNTLARYQQQGEEAWKQQIDKNTQDYADKVVELTGGDGTKLADPTVQQNIQQLYKSYDPQSIDRAKARQVVPQMLAQAQQAQENTIKFNDAKETEEQRPEVDAFQSDLRAGNFDSAGKRLDSKQFRDEDKLTSALERAKAAAMSQQYAANNEGRAERNEVRSEQGFASSQANAALSRQSLTQSIDFAKRDQNMQESQFNQQQTDRADARITTNAAQLNQVADGAIKAQNAKTEMASRSNPFITTNKEETTQASNNLLKGISEGKYDSASWTWNDTDDRKEIQKEIMQKLDPNVGLSFTDKNGQTYRAPASPQLLQQALDATGSEYKINGGSASKHIETYFKNRLADESDPIRAQIVEAQKALQEKAEVEAWAQQIKGNASQMLLKKAGAVKIDPNILRKIQKFGKPEADEEIDDSKTSPY